MERIKLAGNTLKGMLISACIASAMLNYALWYQVITPNTHHQFVTCQPEY